MPKRQETAITKRTVEALSVEGRDAVFWDRDLPGFGIRVYPSGLKNYVVQSRGPGGSRRATLGRHGDTSPEQARRSAAEAIDRIKRGEDPLPPGAGAGADDGRHRGAVHAGLRACALQGVERGGLPAGARHSHSAGAGGDAGRRGRERACVGTALRDAWRAVCSERGAQDRRQDAVPGRGMGSPRSRAEPVPGGAQVPDAAPRAVPDRRRVLPARPGAQRAGSEGGRCRDMRRRRSGFWCLPGAGATRCWSCAGTTWTGRRGSCGCATARPAPAWCR